MKTTLAVGSGWPLKVTTPTVSANFGRSLPPQPASIARQRMRPDFTDDRTMELAPAVKNSRGVPRDAPCQRCDGTDRASVPSPTHVTQSRKLELTHHLAICLAAEPLIVPVVDVLAEEPDGAVSDQHVDAADVERFEPPRIVVFAAVGAGGIGDLLRRHRAGVELVDRRHRASMGIAHGVGEPPAVGLVSAGIAVGSNFTHRDGVRRAVRDIAN